MNKKLFLKVKDLCKDTGVSEKCLKAITEKMGGSIEDDSTDEEAIETTANLIAEVAKETQSEATRWANKKTNKSEEEEEDETKKKGKKSKEESEEEEEKKSPESERIAELEKKIAEMESAQSKGERKAAIAKAMADHKIPVKFRDRLAASISDEDDIDTVVAALKQDFITEGLMTDDSEGSKGASEKQVDEAADSLLDSITVK